MTQKGDTLEVYRVRAATVRRHDEAAPDGQGLDPVARLQYAVDVVRAHGPAQRAGQFVGPIEGTLSIGDAVRRRTLVSGVKCYGRDLSRQADRRCGGCDMLSSARFEINLRRLVVAGVGKPQRDWLASQHARLNKCHPRLCATFSAAPALTRQSRASSRPSRLAWARTRCTLLQVRYGNACESRPASRGRRRPSHQS